MTLHSALPADRTHLGTLSLTEDGDVTLWGPVACLGKADNQGAVDHGNPTRDPEWPYGDHPLGEYAITAWVPTGPDGKEQSKYGPSGKLVLDPLGGPALARKQHGGFGLLIHGGAQGGPYVGFRPTFGCLRLRDADMAGLVAWYKRKPFRRYVAEETAP